MRMLLSVFFLLWAVALHGQNIAIPPDSSFLLFPDNVKVGMSRISTSNATHFRFKQKDFKIMLVEINFLLNQARLTNDHVAALQQNEKVNANIIRLLEEKNNVERQRTEGFKNSFEALEQVVSAYDQELQHCKADLEKTGKRNRNQKRKSLLKGFTAGAGTALLAVFIFNAISD
jgi:hypothetical protein